MRGRRGTRPYRFDMTSTPALDAAPTRRAPLGRAVLVPVGGLVAWTIFVWIGRIRNVFSDATLSTGEQRGALALALSFVVPAVVIGGALVLAGRSHGRPGAESVVRFGVWALGLWSIGVWLVKAIDIAFSERAGRRLHRRPHRPGRRVDHHLGRRDPRRRTPVRGLERPSVAVLRRGELLTIFHYPEVTKFSLPSPLRGMTFRREWGIVSVMASAMACAVLPSTLPLPWASQTSRVILRQR